MGAPTACRRRRRRRGFAAIAAPSQVEVMAAGKSGVIRHHTAVVTVGCISCPPLPWTDRFTWWQAMRRGAATTEGHELEHLDIFDF